MSLVLLQAWIPTGSVSFAANGVASSLSCEAFFYALFPLVLRRAVRLRPAAAWCLTGALASAVLVSPKPGLLYLFPPTPLLELLLGMLLALAVQRGWRLALPLWSAAAATAATALPAMPDNFTYVAVTLVPYCLPIAAAQHDLDGKRGPFSRRWIVVLGQWSFALYMCHQLVIRLVVHYATGAEARAVLALPTLAACLSTAALLYQFVERPLEKRLRTGTVRRSRVYGTRSSPRLALLPE